MTTTKLTLTQIAERGNKKKLDQKLDDGVYNAGMDSIDENHFEFVSELDYEVTEIYNWSRSLDGKKIYDEQGREYILLADDEILFTCNCINKICKIDVNMTWAEWINSAYNTIGAETDGVNVIFNVCETHNGGNGHLYWQIDASDVITVGGWMKLVGNPT